MNVAIMNPLGNQEDIARLSSLLHDARVVTVARAERRVEGTEEFDDVMSLRMSAGKFTVHRAFSDIEVTLLQESVLRVADTGKAVDPSAGMVVHSRKPLDLSCIESLLR